jgi:outer membrane protein TolC
LQPLDVFLKGARSTNFDNREVASTMTQRLAENDAASAKLYPTFAANGTYTYNQYEVLFPIPQSMDVMTIQPHHQFNAGLTVSLPLIDVSAWRRIAASKANTEATRAQERATQLEVESTVSRAYYQVLGQEAVLDAAKRTLEVFRKNLEQVQTKVEGGTASQLDVQRARAEIARAEGDVASAEYAVVTARRQLATASFTEPEPATDFVTDDLHTEQPIETWLGRAGGTPRVQTAQAQQRAATTAADAAEAAWYPTLTASAQEDFTNATAFIGRSASFKLQATLAWRFDASLSPSVRAQQAAAYTQQVRAERAQRGAQDSIFQAWHQVRTSIEKARAARVQIEASQLAAELARDRYAVGAATQLDVLHAEHTAFQAKVAGIQADTELVYARVSLRASAGQFIEGGAK